MNSLPLTMTGLGWEQHFAQRHSRDVDLEPKGDKSAASFECLVMEE